MQDHRGRAEAVSRQRAILLRKFVSLDTLLNEIAGNQPKLVTVCFSGWPVLLLSDDHEVEQVAIVSHAIEQEPILAEYVISLSAVLTGRLAFVNAASGLFSRTRSSTAPCKANFEGGSSPAWTKPLAGSAAAVAPGRAAPETAQPNLKIFAVCGDDCRISRRV